jgi:hypothetical protein
MENDNDNDNTIPQLPVGAANILFEDFLKQKEASTAPNTGALNTKGSTQAGSGSSTQTK